MKPKSKKQKTKKKNEFRFHDIEINKANGKVIKIKHPTYVFLEKGNIYIYVVITHSKKVKDYLVVKLRRNPNPKDLRDSFRIIGARKDTKDKFGKREKDWEIDFEDEQDIRDEYKKEP